MMVLHNVWGESEIEAVGIHHYPVERSHHPADPASAAASDPGDGQSLGELEFHPGEGFSFIENDIPKAKVLPLSMLAPALASPGWYTRASKAGSPPAGSRAAFRRDYFHSCLLFFSAGASCGRCSLSLKKYLRQARHNTPSGLFYLFSRRGARVPPDF